jgi:hypothetical protein
VEFLEKNLGFFHLDEIVSNSFAGIHGNGKRIIPIEPWNPLAIVPVLAGI